MGVLKFVVCFLVLCCMQFQSHAQEVRYTDAVGKSGVCQLFPKHYIDDEYDLEMPDGTEFSESDCCKKCSETPECKGWTHQKHEGKNYCNLKSKVVLLALNPHYNVRVTSGINGKKLEDVVISTDNKYLGLSDQKSTGTPSYCSLHTGYISDKSDVGDLRSAHLNFAQCCHECSITPSCVAWTHYYGTCWLKSSTSMIPGSDGLSGILIK